MRHFLEIEAEKLVTGPPSDKAKTLWDQTRALHEKNNSKGAYYLEVYDLARSAEEELTTAWDDKTFHRSKTLTIVQHLVKAAENLLSAQRLYLELRA